MSENDLQHGNFCLITAHLSFRGFYIRYSCYLHLHGMPIACISDNEERKTYLKVYCDSVEVALQLSDLTLLKQIFYVLGKDSVSGCCKFCMLQFWSLCSSCLLLLNGYAGGY